MIKAKNVAKTDVSNRHQDWLQIAQLRAEKCELREAYEAYLAALDRARKSKDHKTTMEALAGLFRLSGESLDEAGIEKWDHELDQFMKAHPRQIPPMAWYCKGAVARHRNEFMLAQRCFHRYLRAVRANTDSEELVARGWTMLATTLQARNRIKRSMWLANEILRRYENKNLRGINGIVYLLLGTLYERQRDYKLALTWFQKAHAQFLRDHNWYYHLYVLYGYARLARHQQNFPQAYWYLDLVDHAASSPELGLLRREVALERKRLEQDAVDLLIDGRKGVIKTRENRQVHLRKQYVLLQILEALSFAHKQPSPKSSQGLSKAELIEYVWKEPYQSEVHDNKLYYNINRLRKLIEPDVRKPQYLLNWKEGYRLAPGLRVQYVGEQGSSTGGNNYERTEEHRTR